MDADCEIFMFSYKAKKLEILQCSKWRKMIGGKAMVLFKLGLEECRETEFVIL